MLRMNCLYWPSHSSRDSYSHHLFSLQLYCGEPTSANALITKPLLTLLTLLTLLLTLLTLLLTLLTLLLTLLLTFPMLLLALLTVDVSHPGSLCGCTPALQCCHPPSCSPCSSSRSALLYGQECYCSLHITRRSPRSPSQPLSVGCTAESGSPNATAAHRSPSPPISAVVLRRVSPLTSLLFPLLLPSPPLPPSRRYPPQPQRLILPTLLDPQFSLWLYLRRACHRYSCSSSCSSHPSFPSTPSERGMTPYPHPHHPSFINLPTAAIHCCRSRPLPGPATWSCSCSSCSSSHASGCSSGSSCSFHDSAELTRHMPSPSHSCPSCSHSCFSCSKCGNDP